ncbi:hypothetical protein PHMEG_00016373 [Phytophthora megakarya]|uniref:RxLR effector protein n=1 Tax=Phytophthora megakarya TaxID=4795 RepID=A0A225VZ65_9STRA|nr:hypothetical protein PHMEG_00016373 [Phytophthora megakarya]
MSFCQITLVIHALSVLFIGVVTVSTGVLAEDGTQSHLARSVVSGTNTIGKRFLRADTTDATDEGKSDDFVKEKLKLTGLSGVALTSNKNYKHFKKFVMIKTWNQLDAWRNTETPTYDVWRTLGFGNMNTWDDLMNAADTDAFKLYQQYADYFDNYAITKAFVDHKAISVLSGDTPWTERVARMVSWKENDKDELYVMVALGFDKLSPAALEANTNGKTFMIYWLLKHDNSLNTAQNTKDVLLNLRHLKNLSPTELTKLKNKDSLDTAQQRTKVLLRYLLDIKDLPRPQVVSNDKYQTYKYLYGLIKKQTTDEYTSNLLEALVPRL